MASMEILMKLQVLQRLVQGRWFFLAVAILLMSTSGGVYSFGVYSQDIKTSLGYDQKTLNTIGFFKDFGMGVGVIAGLLCDFGPPLVILVFGAVENLLGYLMIWLAVTSRIARPQAWQMCLYIAIGANSTAFFNTASVALCVKLFSTDKATVIGLVKGFLGLSGAIVTQVYLAIYGPNHPSSFLLLLSWLPTGVSLACAFVLTRRLPPFIGRPHTISFYGFLGVGLAVAAYLMGVIVAENVSTLSSVSYKLMGFAMAIVFLLPLIWAVVRSELYGNAGEMVHKLTPRELDGHELAGMDSAREADTEAGAGLQKQPDEPLDALSGTLLGPVEKLFRKLLGKCGYVRENGSSEQVTYIDQKESQVGIIKVWPRQGEDHTILEAFSSVDFWLLFVATTCGIGSGLTAIDNMGQIGAALGYSTVKVSTFVSLVSIWNSLGRWVAGFLSEKLLQRRGISRPTLYAVSLGIMAIGHLLLACNVPGCLYIGSILIGLCYGIMWSLVTIITSDIFGMRFFATLFNVVLAASPVGNYFLSVRLAGYLYDREARKQQKLLTPSPAKSKALICHGPTCYRLTFYVLMAVALVGSIICVLLAIRTRQLYKELEEKPTQVRENDISDFKEPTSLVKETVETEKGALTCADTARRSRLNDASSEHYGI